MKMEKMNIFKDPNGQIYNFSDADLAYYKEQERDIIAELQLEPYEFPVPTEEEIAAEKLELERLMRINKAKQLLQQNDFRWNAVKLTEYTEDKKEVVLAYRKALVDVVNEVSNEIPELQLDMFK